MKRLWLVTILIIALAGCRRSTAPGGGQCNQGLCVKIEVAEPIRWGELIIVTITVTTEIDIPDLGVSINTYPLDVIVEGPTGWEATSTGGMVWEGGAGWLAEGKSNQVLTFVREIRFPTREGSFDLQANATTPQGLRVTNSVRIHLTREGGKAYYSGTPIPTLPLSGVAMGRVRTSEGVDCSPGPCLTIRVVEPVLWGEPVQAFLHVAGNKKERVYSLPTGQIALPIDFPRLGLTFYSPDLPVQIKPETGEFHEHMIWPAGNGVWWVTDVWADSTQEYTFWVTFPSEEGIYYLDAEAYDLVLGAISWDAVAVEITREGGKVFAPSLGTPFPTETPRPTPLPTPTFPLPVRTPTPEAYPQPESPSLLSPLSPTPAAYP